MKIVINKYFDTDKITTELRDICATSTGNFESVSVKKSFLLDVADVIEQIAYDNDEVLEAWRKFEKDWKKNVAEKQEKAYKEASSREKRLSDEIERLKMENYLLRGDAKKSGMCDNRGFVDGFNTESQEQKIEVLKTELKSTEKEKAKHNGCLSRTKRDDCAAGDSCHCDCAREYVKKDLDEVTKTLDEIIEKMGKIKKDFANANVTSVDCALFGTTISALKSLRNGYEKQNTKKDEVRAEANGIVLMSGVSFLDFLFPGAKK